ncbi:MAG: DUF3445 domain-containing protein [Pseudomonadota bacterium]
MRDEHQPEFPWLLDQPAETPFMEPRTARPPGISPVGGAAVLVQGPDFAAQMAYRDRLIAEEAEAVLALDRDGEAPAAELYEEVIGMLSAAPGYACGAGVIERPDGVAVDLDPSARMATLGRLVAEDLCLMVAAKDGRHRLVGAVLCFPSRWSLAEKMGYPLDVIHEPVPDYGDDLARRVERLFGALRPERPLVRANWLIHGTAELFLPMHSGDKAPVSMDPQGRLYLRTERQTLMRLPLTEAAVFLIRTQVCPLTALSADQAAALAREFGALDADSVGYRAGADLYAHAMAELRVIAGQSPSA